MHNEPLSIAVDAKHQKNLIRDSPHAAFSAIEIEA
jgi:hypothetical protein